MVRRSLDLFCVNFTILLLVPSAAPKSLSVSQVTSSSITVQWEPVQCIHQNGEITGYLIQYGVASSGIVQSMLISGESATDAAIKNLRPDTVYEIFISAINSEGTGINSSKISEKTLDEGRQHSIQHNYKQHNFFS